MGWGRKKKLKNYEHLRKKFFIFSYFLAHNIKICSTYFTCLEQFSLILTINSFSVSSSKNGTKIIYLVVSLFFIEIFLQFENTEKDYILDGVKDSNYTVSFEFQAL